MEWLLGVLPFYYEFKIALLIWMIFPISFLGEASGATIIYNTYFQPLLASREKVIDDILFELGISA